MDSYLLIRNRAQQKLVKLVAKARQHKYETGDFCNRQLRELALLYAILTTLTRHGESLSYHDLQELSNEVNSIGGYDLLPYKEYDEAFQNTRVDRLYVGQAAPHNHDTRYYTKPEVDALIDGSAAGISEYLPSENYSEGAQVRVLDGSAWLLFVRTASVPLPPLVAPHPMDDNANEYWQPMGGSGKVPVAPEGWEWVSEPTVNTDVNGSNANIIVTHMDDAPVVSRNGVNQILPIDTVHTTALPTGDNKRIDILGVDATGWAYIQGDASLNPTSKAIPADFLFATYIILSATGAEVKPVIEYIPTVFDKNYSVDMGGKSFNVSTNRNKSASGYLSMYGNTFSGGSYFEDLQARFGSDANETGETVVASMYADDATVDNSRAEVKVTNGYNETPEAFLEAKSDKSGSLQSTRFSVKPEGLFLNGQPFNPGSGIASTDDIATEGTTNKWFTDARAIAARATANLWNYLGLTDAAATISLKGWLDFLTNKVKLNEESLATKQNTLTFDASPTSGSANPVTSGGAHAADEGVKTNIKTLFGTTVDQHFLDTYATGQTRANVQESFSYDEGRYQNTASTFSGWGCPIGIPKNFNKVVFKVKARSGGTAITAIKCTIKENDKLGAILAETTLAVNIGAGLEQNVEWSLGATLENAAGTKLFFSYQCNALTDQYGITDTLGYYPVADGYGKSVYFTNGSQTGNGTDASTRYLTWVEVSSFKNLIGYTDEAVSYLATKIAQSDSFKYRPVLDFFLPANIYTVQGVEMNVYWDNIVLSEFPIKGLNIDVIGGRGKHYERFWRYTPATTDLSGSTALTVSVKYEGVELGRKTATLYLPSTTAADGKSIKVLPIGDSTTAAGQYVTTIINDYGPLLKPAMTFIGTQGSGTTKHEGRSGWKFSDFATVGRTFYKFTASGLTTTPTAGAVYSNNGSQFTVRETNFTSGSGNFSCERTSGTNNPLATGTLTKVSGTGDSSIAYSAMEIIAGNPFWNNTTQQLDFANYLTTNGFTLSATDLVTVHLGINDVFNSASETVLNSIKTDFDALVANIRQAIPGINIGLCITIPPSISQDAFAENYNTLQHLKGYMANYRTLVKMLLETYDTATHKANKLHCIPFNCNIDRYYNFPKTTMQANARNTATVETWNNGVHPDISGYNQMADTLYSFIRNIV